MKLRQLEYFQRIVEKKSFSKAADSLYVSQPGISEAIRHLEEELGVTLILRDRSRLSFTDEGMLFYEKAKEILAGVSDMVQEVNDLHRSLSDSIVIVIPPILGHLLFHKIFIDFKRQFPDQKIIMKERGSDSAIQMVYSQEADFGFVVYDDHLALETIPLIQTEIAFCTANNNPLSKVAALSFDAVKNEPLIMLKQGYYHNKIVVENFKKISYQPNILLQTNQLSTIMTLIKNGIGSAFLLKAIISDNEIVPVSLTPSLTVKIGLVWSSSKPVPEKNRRMIQYVRQLRSGHFLSNTHKRIL